MGTFKEISRWYNAAYVSPTSQELALHQELISRWTSFAKTGNPNNVNYGGWLPVPIQGPNRDGSATEIDQQYFSLEHGGVMWSGTSMNEVIEYCSAFPRWNPFALVTDFPTFSPTEYLPDRTRRPSRRPTRVPTRRPFQRIRRDTPSPTDFPTEFPTLSPTEYFPPTPTRTRRPTRRPTHSPTRRPTHSPTRPDETREPTLKPTPSPTHSPTVSSYEYIICPVNYFYLVNSKTKFFIRFSLHQSQPLTP